MTQLQRIANPNHGAMILPVVTSHLPAMSVNNRHVLLQNVNTIVLQITNLINTDQVKRTLFAFVSKARKGGRKGKIFPREQSKLWRGKPMCWLLSTSDACGLLKWCNTAWNPRVMWQRELIWYIAHHMKRNDIILQLVIIISWEGCPLSFYKKSRTSWLQTDQGHSFSKLTQVFVRSICAVNIVALTHIFQVLSWTEELSQMFTLFARVSLKSSRGHSLPDWSEIFEGCTYGANMVILAQSCEVTAHTRNSARQTGTGYFPVSRHCKQHGWRTIKCFHCRLHPDWSPFYDPFPPTGFSSPH